MWNCDTDPGDSCAQRLYSQALLGLKWGVLSHHLSVLSRRGDILLEYHGRRLWAFPPTTPPDQRATHALVNIPGRRDLLKRMENAEDATIRSLSHDMQESRRFVQHHLSHLMLAGRVQRDGPAPHRYRCTDAEPPP